jgi:hypothetical protein
MRNHILILLVFSTIYSCSPPSSSQQIPDPDSMAAPEDAIIENTDAGAGQKIGDLQVEWESPLSEDPEGNTAMGGNGISYLALRGEDRFRISILDLNAPLADASPEKREIFETGYLRTYKNNLSQMGVPFEEVDFNGVKALEYTMLDSERSAKSLLFIYGNNGYTIQVTAASDIESSYQEFVKSIRF